MSCHPKSYVFDNGIQSAQSLNNSVSANFSNINQTFEPTLKVLGEWNDKRGRKVLNKFKFEADQNKAHIEEAVSYISSSVDKCVSDLGAAKSAYDNCVNCIFSNDGGHSSISDKLHREWHDWKEVHW